MAFVINTTLAPMQQGSWEAAALTDIIHDPAAWDHLLEVAMDTN